MSPDPFSNEKKTYDEKIPVFEWKLMCHFYLSVSNYDDWVTLKRYAITTKLDTCEI